MTYNGKAVQDTDTFTVVINNYRFNGGGNYVQYINEHGCDFKSRTTKAASSTPPSTT